MDRKEEKDRAESVDRYVAQKYKRRNYITGKKVIETDDHKIGINNLKLELDLRKDRGLGEGSSLYLQRRYNQRKNEQKKQSSSIWTPREQLMHQTFYNQQNRDTDLASPLNNENDALYQTHSTPRDPYFDKLVVQEDQISSKMKIPKNWERNPMTDRNYYMKSPQFRFSMGNGDFDHRGYQSRMMQRRFKQQDSFTKVLPMYHHYPESSYQNNQSQTHRTHQQIKKDDLGRELANIDLRNFKKTDFLQGYQDMIYCMPELAPKPRKMIINQAGEPWKMNVMHSMWPINSIYHGKYQSGSGGGNQL